MASRIYLFIAILIVGIQVLLAEERPALSRDEILVAAGLVEVEKKSGEPEICSGVAVDKYVVLTLQECLKDRESTGSIFYYPSYYEAYTASPIGTIKGKRYIKGKQFIQDSARETEQGGKAFDPGGRPGSPHETPSGGKPGPKKNEIIITVLRLDQPAPQFLPLAVQSDGRGNYSLLQSYVDTNTGMRHKQLDAHGPGLSLVGYQSFRYVPSLRGSPLLQQDNRDKWWSNDDKNFSKAGSGQYPVVNTVGLVAGPGALMLITEQHIWQVKKLLYGDE